MPVATIWLSAPSSSHGQNAGAGHGTLSPVTAQHDGEEQDRKRKAEQETDIGRAPGTERPGQRALHRIAPTWPSAADNGEGNPERRDGEHGGDRLEGFHLPGGAGAVNCHYSCDPTRVVPACRATIEQLQRGLHLLRHHHVVHVHVGREAPFIGERAVDHAELSVMASLLSARSRASSSGVTNLLIHGCRAAASAARIRRRRSQAQSSSSCG